VLSHLSHPFLVRVLRSLFLLWYLLFAILCAICFCNVTLASSFYLNSVF
jgi:hypothetical protein